MKALLCFIFLLFSFDAMSHTWDEPWHKEVVADSDTFALYEVVSNSGFSIKLKLLKHLAGTKTKNRVKISRYSLFESTSKPEDLSDHRFEYSKGDNVYVFLKKQGKRYAVATPLSGISTFLDDESVIATFRHSAHRAKAEINSYEVLQTCIFNYLHGLECSEEAKRIVKESLQKPVGVLSERASEEDANSFFSQHAALETSYLAEISNPIEILQPFLKSDFFHVQTSAIRALAGSDYENKEEELLKFVISDDRSGTARVMAIILLNEFPSITSVSFLGEYLNKASEDEVHLGVGSIMDPRIGTWYPSSVKAAVQWFLDENKALIKSTVD